jgi:CubicO group peptidase (beta-lactamase class C family)
VLIRSCLVAVAVLLTQSKELGEKLAAVAKEKLSANSAAVLVARGDDVLLHEGFGAADVGDGTAGAPSRKIDRETRFAIGSITKLFTAVAILRLEQQGKLTTDDKLADHLDGVPADKSKITLHQLLTHSAGLLEYHDQPGEGGDFAPMNKDEAVGRILEQKLRFEPGTQSHYSNSGYTLLAAVVEEAGGEPWTKYLREELFVPAEMKSTSFFGETCFKQDSIALGRGKKVVKKNDPDEWLLTWSLMGNGGIISTVADLWHFCRALEGEKLLDEKRREKLFTSQMKLKDGGAEGYGWMAGRTKTGEEFFEVAGGDDLGFLAEMRWQPKARLFIAITSNSQPQPGALPRVVDGLLDVLAAKDAAPAGH